MDRIIDIVLPAIPQTLIMVIASTIIALLIGLLSLIHISEHTRQVR